MKIATSRTHVRTRRHIRTMCSLLTSARPQRCTWPRRRETELMAQQDQLWRAARQS